MRKERHSLKERHDRCGPQEGDNRSGMESRSEQGAVWDQGGSKGELRLECNINGGSACPLITYFHAFHAQNVRRNKHPRPNQYVVEDGLTRGPGTAGPNARAQILQCGRVGSWARGWLNGIYRVWQPGRGINCPLAPSQRIIADFGEFLR